VLCLYDDRRDMFYPFSFLRPLSEMRNGMLTQRERIEKVTELRTAHVITAPHLEEVFAGYFRERDRTGGFEMDARGFSCSIPVVFLTSRLLPSSDAGRVILTSPPGSIFRVGSEIAGCVLPPVKEKIPFPDLVSPSKRKFEALLKGSAEEVALDSGLIDSVWEIITANKTLLMSDFDLLGGGGLGLDTRDLPDSVTVKSAAAIMVSREAVISSHVVLDADSGPIWIEEGANVRPFSHIEGPSYIGRGTIISAALVRGGTTIGPVCRVGGEIECTIFQGYTNKAHDGFLGHSYVGEWINLGAGTTNSDLKNNYSPVRVTLAGQVYETGMLKMGSLLGDHVKTGIGTLLDTGAVLGAGCNVFGGGVQPKYVPAFIWGGNGRYLEYRMKDFLETAAIVIERRGVPFQENQRRLLEYVYRLTGPERTDWLVGRKED